MLRRLGIAMIVLGVLVAAFAVIWWQIIVPELVKLPSDIDSSVDFEGELTLHVDEDTGVILGDGNEEIIPVTATRRFAALPDLFTSSTGFFEDTMDLSIGDKTAEPQLARYALSRTSRECTQSDENWAFTEDNKIDRAGAYGPLFPTRLNVGDTVTVYYDDPFQAFEVEVVDTIENWNGHGITVLEIDASRPSTPYDPASAEVLLLRGQPLPTQVTLGQIRSILQFDFDIPASVSVPDTLPGGIPVPGGALIPSSIEIPAAVRAAIARIERTINDYPLALSFNQECNDFYYIERTTGATVDATFDRTCTVTVDTSLVGKVTDLLGGYTTLPVVGSTIASALDRLGEATAPYQAAITAFTQEIGMTEASQAAMVQEAKDKISLLNWVQFRIPVIAGAAGGLILLVGLISALVPRSEPAPNQGEPLSPERAARRG